MPGISEPHPQTVAGDLANPPQALAPLCLEDRWLVFRWQLGKNGKWTKPPYRADQPDRYAKNDDPSTWAPRSIAVAAVLAGKAHGLGFVLTDTEYGAVDLDGCRDPETGAIAPWAQAVLDKAPDAYHEVTVSGTGLRIIGTITGEPVHRKFTVDGNGAAVEVYRRATRYITVSGAEIGHCTGLPNIDAVIDDVVVRYDTQPSQKKEGTREGAAGNGFDFDGATFVDEIDELLKNGAPEGQRSEAFSRVVWSLAGQGLSQDEIVALLQQHPNGIASKYSRRLHAEVGRCHAKWRRRRDADGAAGGPWAGAGSTPGNRTAVLVRANELTPESIDWAWKDRFAFGKLGVLAGDPGLGKSTLLLEIAALHSNRGEFPCGEGRARGCETLILTAEDGLRDTAVPRLIAAGADMSKIHFLVGTRAEGGGKDDEMMFDLAKDVSVLRAVLEANPSIGVLIIDPLTAYLGANTKAKENAEVRRVLAPLVKLIEETGVLVLANNHLNKGAGKAIYRVLDSIAFVAVGRTVHLVVEDADNPDNRKLLCSKTNIGSKPLGLTYIIQKVWIKGEQGEEIETSRICWGTSHITDTADEALSDHERDPTATDDAVAFLRIVLAEGPVKVADVEAEAREACFLRQDQQISQSKPFRAARKVLDVTTKKTGLSGGWSWSLPKAP